ncbi:MAG: FtsX-like permease family protein [Acidobacteriota bacterium]
MLGLGVGVATLLISLSLLSGLQDQIKGRLIASSPNLLIEPEGRSTIENDQVIIRAAATTPLRSVQPVISGIAWAANPSEGSGRPVQLRSFQAGVQPQFDRSLGREMKLPQTPPGRYVYMTRDFAAGLGLSLGERVTIVAPRTRLTPFGPVPIARQYQIAGLLPASTEENKQDVVLPFTEASDLFDTNGLPTSIEIYAVSPSDVELLQSHLQAEFPNLLIKTWKEINHPLFLALRLEKVVMFATISLIILVAALNLISSLSMLIVEKRPQIGVLRTLGASEGSILRIFLSVGLLIGLVGTTVGNAIGLGVSWAADRYHLVPLPSDVYSVSHIPFAINLQDVLWVNAVAIVLSVAATWYPSRIASRLDPIVAIREE